MDHKLVEKGIKTLDLLVRPLVTEKYGVIPKKCFPESHSSEASRRMNDILNHKVRLRTSFLNRRSGRSVQTLRSGS